MATNLALDDNLINAALEAGHHRSKKEAVTEALQMYIRALKQQDILSVFGTVSFDPKYEYKKGRSR